MADLKRKQGERWPDYLERCRAAANAGTNADRARRAARMVRRKFSKRGIAERREDIETANRVDGFDRDDLGESPDR